VFTAKNYNLEQTSSHVQSDDEGMSIDDSQSNPEQYSKEMMKIKQYTLLHYACSGGDIDIFDFIFLRCKDLKDVLTNTSENRT